MFLMPIDKKEIIKLTGDRSVKKTNYIYCLSTEFVKIISHYIAPTLSDTFNKSFETGIFPDHMQIAMISPIFKGGSRLEVSNYRPVSVFPILSKLPERLMQDRLTNFLDENKIICGHQFGFRRTEVQL